MGMSLTLPVSRRLPDGRSAIHRGIEPSGLLLLEPTAATVTSIPVPDWGAPPGPPALLGSLAGGSRDGVGGGRE